MTDRFDLAGAVGLLLILVAAWAVSGWPLVAFLAGAMFLIYAYVGADRSKKR